MDMAGDGQRRDTPADNSVSIKNIKFLHNLSNTFAGAMTGLGLVFVAIFVLFLNETSIVVSSQRINDKLKSVAGLESIHRVLQENNNKLVYITGQLRTNQPLTDGQFGIEAHVLKLRREVQMFQWIEHTRSSSESGSNPSEINTVYTKEWRSEAVASESFLKPDRHQNKKEFPVKSTTFVATHAYVGSYYIKENLKEKMEEFHPLPTLQPNDEYNIEFHNGWYYQKGVATHPEVGDVRDAFFTVESVDKTIIPGACTRSMLSGSSLKCEGQITYAFSCAICAQLTQKNYHQLYRSLPRAAGLASSIWPDPVPWPGHSFPVTRWCGKMNK
ncbi:putative transmembrane protein [Apostichopus japonicus]|uniref:Putative transmembrane protein n=1 Tax=Stichopus japonicus TaxID=307972 RepID=A0A2G8L4S3_STIJA|nr:putative transmembrane protein [Apostichopus japonicus]